MQALHGRVQSFDCLKRRASDLITSEVNHLGQARERGAPLEAGSDELLFEAIHEWADLFDGLGGTHALIE